MERMLALMMVAGLLTAVVVLVYAGVQRYRQQTIPRLAGYVGVAALGLGWSPTLIWFAGEPLRLLLAVACGTGVVALLLAFTHRYRLAGVLFLAVGLPGTLWWGRYIVEDVLDHSFSYEPILLGWFVPGLGLVFLGAVGIAAGNRTAWEASLGMAEPRAASLAAAIMRDQSIGPLPISTLVAVALGIVTFRVASTLGQAADLAWPVPWLLAGALSAVVMIEAFARFVPRRVRAGWEGFSVLGSWEQRRFEEVSGGPVPVSPSHRARWLTQHSLTPETAWMHAELHTVSGSFDEARRAIEQMPEQTAWQRVERLAAQAYLDWVADGGGDLEPLRSAAEQVGGEGSEERLRARAHVAVAEARQRAASGGDWAEPLIAIREAVGPRAGRLLRADTAPMRRRAGLIIASLLTVFAAALDRLF
jgi:hypothetical protein